MKKTALKALLAVLSLVIAFVIAELVYRAVRPASDAGATMSYVRADGKPLDPNSLPDLAQIAYYINGEGGLPKGEKPAPVPPAPRSKPPHAWRPDAHFYLQYSGPQQPYFDDEGRVEYRFNSVGIREEDDLTYAPKPEGQYRILCQGDSFTLGWGVPAEDNWTTRVEEDLQQTHPEVRTVNTGMAGQSYADEYWFALRDRLHRLQPDMVLVSLCLNDLIITNGKLAHFRDAALADTARDPASYAWWESSVMLRDLARAMRGPLDLDPEHDYVTELLNLPADHVAYTDKNESPELYWAAGTPQNALRAMRDWCDKRETPFGVIVWPLFQGLEQDQFYPFEKLHRMVVAFCEDEAIKVLDLLPAFRGFAAEDLWVSPCDMHGNKTAMNIASQPIAAFARVLGGFEKE